MLLPPLIALALVRPSPARARSGLRAAPPPTRRSGRESRATSASPCVVLFAVFALAGGAHGAPLDAPANPLGDYPARPEWFLLPMFQLRHFFHGAMEFWGTSLVPGAAAGYLVMLPWIDRPGRSRALVVAPVIAIFGGAVVLALVARSHDAHDSHYRKARAKADAQAAAAIELAMNGVPPAGRSGDGARAIRSSAVAISSTSTARAATSSAISATRRRPRRRSSTGGGRRRGSRR